MSNMQRRRKLIPSWDMPSDPVKAVFWFMHWLLKVLVRFFWIPVLAGVTYESFINGVIGGVVTLLVGLGVWLGLAVVLFFFTVGTRISKTVADVGRMQQGFPPRRPPPFSSFAEPDIDTSKVVEGTVTNLEEERRKRRRE
ncbi:MAG: hypothetical protein ACR2H5_10900 [Ktedonobacteraceae bacterium]